MRKLKPIAILCFFTGMLLSAQTETMSGKVTDGETGEPLTGAQVFVKGTFVGTTTDVTGSYQLDVDDNVT
ncbi:MAG: hypothetical protein HOA05_00220, partial [Candidatus Marinimicrobia bacterium]|nr:hypothetical protein [Candidatus Neomarinimicrobiota bacterium]